MDLTKLTLVTLLVAMLAEAVKRKAPKVWKRGDLFLLMALGVGAVFLVSYTTWSSQQVFMGVSLDNMRVADKFVSGLIVAGGAWGFSQVVQKAIPSIGQNQPLTPQALEAKGLARQGVTGGTPDA